MAGAQLIQVNTGQTGYLTGNTAEARCRHGISVTTSFVAVGTYAPAAACDIADDAALAYGLAPA